MKDSVHHRIIGQSIFNSDPNIEIDIINNTVYMY